MLDFSDFGLCCGSIAGADFRALVECAGNEGFRFITLWPSLYDRARESGLSATEMRSILADNGVSVSELDPLCTWLPSRVAEDDIAASFFQYREADFFRIADEIGARSLNVIQASNDPVGRAEVVDSLSALCERAAQHELIVSVEFMPWSPLRDLGTALDLVTTVGRDDCGVNVDTWHHFRSGGTITDLAALRSASIAAVQLSDVESEPWDDLLEETARARRLPGEGASDSASVIRAFDQADVQAPINIEVFSENLQKLSPRGAASTLAESVRRVLAQAGQGASRNEGESP